MRSNDFLFRALLLATLLWFAVGFGVYQNYRGQPNKHEKQSSKETQNIRENEGFWVRTTSDPTAFFTMALAGLTFVLSVTGVVQIFYLRRTDETARKTANAALKSAIAAERALEGADAPFISVIPEINAVKKNMIGGKISIQFMDGERVIRFFLINYGKSPAIVLEVYKGLLVSNTIPEPTASPPPPPPPQTNLYRVQIVGPDKQTPIYYINISETIMAGGDAKLKWVDGRDRPLWIVFQIRYRDALGAQFLSGHTFAFNANLAEFYSQGGTKHNYRRKLTDEERAAMELRDTQKSQ